MRKVALGRFSWRVTNLRALVLWFILGGIGAHRVYVGRWSTGLMILAYTLGTTLAEIYIIDPMSSIPMETKSNISLGFTVALWAFLIRDLFLLRGFIDEVNSPKISEIFE